MGSEIAIPVFGPLIIIGVVALLALAIAGRKSVPTESSMLGLGRRRIAMGYLGALIVLAGYNYFETIDLSHLKITRGDVTAAAAAQFFWGWYVFGLCLITPFAIFFLTVLGLPLLALLRQFGFASVFGAFVVSQLVALGLSLFVSQFLNNPWCDSHFWKCLFSNFRPTATVVGVITLGFVIAARLPWWRSTRLVNQQ